MSPWYRREPLRFAAAALLAGLVLGGLVTFALGRTASSPKAIPERSVAEAIASDQAAKPTATPTATPKAAAKPAPKRAKRKPARSARARTAAAPAATATATPDDEERGDDAPAATPAPVRAAPRKAPQQIADKRRPTITPQRKPAKAPSSTPAPATPAPAPTQTAPAPASTPAPTAAPPTRPGPHRPPTGGGGGDDDDPNAASVTARGPGRVNLIGEHTDYNGGLALPFAIDRGVTVTAERLDGDRVEAEARDLGERDAFALAAPGRADGWRAFVRGTVGELGAAGVALAPARLTITGDLPQGSGLSSSAALEAALSLALLGIAGVPEPDRVELAKLCSRVENDWVGAETGLLDQLASLLGAEGEALRIDFATLAIERIPLDLQGWQLVTLDSGATHSIAASGYNERRGECEAAARELGVEHLSAADPDAVERLADPGRRRARHVLSENRRVDDTVAALRAGDLEAVGRLLDASHASLRDDYEASVPEVEATVAELKRAGAAGARMMGGGFGGAVLALLPVGCPRPDGAVVVAPGPAARLL